MNDGPLFPILHKRRLYTKTCVRVQGEEGYTAGVDTCQPGLFSCFLDDNVLHKRRLYTKICVGGASRVQTIGKMAGFGCSRGRLYTKNGLQRHLPVQTSFVHRPQLLLTEAPTEARG